MNTAAVYRRVQPIKLPNATDPQYDQTLTELALVRHQLQFGGSTIRCNLNVNRCSTSQIILAPIFFVRAVACQGKMEYVAST